MVLNVIFYTKKIQDIVNMLNFYILFVFLSWGKYLHPCPTFKMDPSLLVNRYIIMSICGCYQIDFLGKKLDQTAVTSVADWYQCRWCKFYPLILPNYVNISAHPPHQTGQRTCASLVTSRWICSGMLWAVWSGLALIDEVKWLLWCGIVESD